MSSSSRWGGAARRSRRSPTVAPDVESLLALSRRGRHAASDYLETAALAGVETVGCRRCGGGLAGAVAVSNVPRGRAARGRARARARALRRQRRSDPADRRRRAGSWSSTARDPDVATGYLNEFRHLVSDLVILTMAEPGTGWEELHAARSALAPKVIPTTLRPRPTADVAGRRVAFFSTAPQWAHALFAAHLAEEHGADVVHVSGALADRAALRAELAEVDADVFLVELKAAAIDVVAEAASERGVEVVLAGSDVRARRRPGSRRRAAAARGRGSGMSERTKGERNVLGSAESPYSKGLMARALTAVGLREDEAYELARRTESDLAQRGEVVRRPRPAAGARERRPRRRARPARGPPAPPLPRPAGARPARDPARRRRHGHRQVDRRHRGRLPARDHPRHLDRLRPPDDAGVLREGVHALDPLLELRGRPRPDEGRGGGVRRRGAARLPRPDPQRPHRRRGRDRSGRSTRAGRWCSRASTSCRG